MKRHRSFNILNRNKSKSLIRKQQGENKQYRSSQKKSLPDQILQHIKKRSDVEIIVHYDEYREQFFTKCKRLQNYLYKYPLIKDKYVTDANPHFKFAMQHMMLDLYRRGVIVPESWTNLRMDAVNQMQKWVLSWIQRKLTYEKIKEEQKAQILKSCQVLVQMQNYVRIIEVEELPF